MVFNITVRASGLARDVATATALGLLGDVVCQGLVESQGQFDQRRAASLALFNAAYIGGFLHVLYQTYSPVAAFIAKKVGAPASVRMAGSAQHGLACALVDNVHCGTIYIPAFFMAVGTLQGQSLHEAWQVLRSEWWTTYATCSGFWIPFMWANFKFAPAHRRVQVMCVGNLVWNVVIDYLAARGKRDFEDQEQSEKGAKVGP